MDFTLSEKSNLVNPKNDFFSTLPQRPYCSNSKKLELILDKEQAKEYQYIQAQYGIIHYLIYDLDYPGSAYAAREKGIADPTLNVINRANGHAHYLYQIDKIYPPSASVSSKALLKDVLAAYKELLDADRAWTGQKQLVKNCLSGKWDVLTGKAHTLSELAEYIPPHIKKYKKSHTYTPGQTMPEWEACIRHGRNSTLFEFLRHYAYRIAGGCGSMDEMYQSLYIEAEERNHKDIPRDFRKALLASEVRGIVKSIAAWTWKRKDTFKKDFKNVGVMGFEKRTGVFIPAREFEAETRRRQRGGAGYTAEKKRERSEQRIIAAYADCIREGGRITYARIAGKGEIHRNTLQNHKKLFENNKLTKIVHKMTI